MRINVAEIEVLHALIAPVAKGASHSTGVIVEHLRSCVSISTYLCRALADLLDEHGTSALQLRLGRRDNRRMLSKPEVDRDVIAYYLVQELTSAVVTDALCRDVLAGLPGWELKQQREYLFQRNCITEIRLRPGKRISKNIAIKIAAFQINKSLQAVKKMIAAVEAVNRKV